MDQNTDYDTRPLKRVRSSVSMREADIALYAHELEAMNTRVFQRLFWVRQLGFAYLVYPDASHTRGEHSLGVVNVAEALIRHLSHPDVDSEGQLDVDWKRAIRLAALLHDIGQTPCGHTLEYETGVIGGEHDSWERVRPLLDELQTEMRDWHGSELREEIEESFKLARSILLTMSPECKDIIKDIVEIKHETPYNADVVLRRLQEQGIADSDDMVLDADHYFAADIVGNTVSADLLDYVRRDARNCGLPLDYDERLLYFATLERDVVGRYRMAFRLYRGGRFRNDVATTLTEILRMRYFLAERVYYHHAKNVASAMMSRAWETLGCQPELLLERGDEGLLRVLEDKLKEEQEKLKKMKDKADTEYSAMEEQYQRAARLVKAFLARRLYKMVFRVTRDERQRTKKADEDVADRYYGQSKAIERFVEDCESELGLPPGSLVMYCPDKDMSLKHSAVMVQIKPTEPVVPLNELSDVYPGQHNDVANEVKALEGRYQSLWNLVLCLNPQISDYQFQVVKLWNHASSRLWDEEIQNDPLLEAELSDKPALKDAIEASQQIDSMGDEARGLLAQAAREGEVDPKETASRAVDLTLQSHQVSAPDGRSTKKKQKPKKKPKLQTGREDAPSPKGSRAEKEPSLPLPQSDLKDGEGEGTDAGQSEDDTRDRDNTTKA